MILLPTPISSIAGLRNDYFRSLPEFQELYVELAVAEADCYLFQERDVVKGYVICSREGVLLEFFVTNSYLPESNRLFRLALTELSISEIYCKSFDSLLLSNCLMCSLPYSVLGILFRDYAEPRIEKDPEITMERANLSSAEFLLSQDDSIRELFETEEQLTDFILKEHVFTFHLKDVFVGCGMIIRTHPDWEYCDLGIWVHPSKRGKSFGSQILLQLREFALAAHMKPSCGCAVENIASRKAIEKSGFVSRHKLICFKHDRTLHID